MKLKKGVIEVQFNWIFVLVVGAVILTLFTSMLLKQKSISDTSKDALISRSLEAILSGSETTQNSANKVDIPETRITFRCNTYTVGKLSERIETLNVFTPSILEGDDLISMTLDFSIPYRVVNLIYLTNPNIRYIFVGQDLAMEMQSLMPNQSFSEHFLTIENVRSRGEKTARIAFFNDFISDGQTVPGELQDIRDLTALNAKQAQVEFFEKDGDKFILIETLPYIGKETLLGAIYSEDPELYACVMNNVFEKIGIVTKIYIEKTKSIVKKYADHRCNSLQSTAYDLTNLQQILSSSIVFSSANIGNIQSAADRLKEQNKLAQKQSCAVIY